MADLDNNTPAPIIIIRRKKSGHDAHHGGAWKVAYADFVTALMALFIVLWIVNTSQDVRDAVSGYFKDPRGFGKDSGTAKEGTGKAANSSVDISKATMADLKKKLEEAMKKKPELEKLKNQVEITVTNEGLRIELLETEKGAFFESGSPHPTPFGAELIELLGKEIGRLPNHVLIEGHTDSRPYVSMAGYSNWELSADRANSARRLMQTNGGLRDDQVSEVRGYAAQRLRKPKEPQDASNRRISVTVQFLDSPPDEHPAAAVTKTDAKAKPSPVPPAAPKR
jgi:chemotaxis protein MotB